jgi:hypothetical protein
MNTGDSRIMPQASLSCGTHRVVFTARKSGGIRGKIGKSQGEQNTWQLE